MFNPGFTSEGTYSPDMLIAGDHPVRTMGVTVVSGAGVLVRGSVLGKITSGGKYTLSASAASNGSQTPQVILGEDVDATSGDVVAFTYIAGDFNSNSLTLGAGHTVASIREGFRDKSIFLHNPVTA